MIHLRPLVRFSSRPGSVAALFLVALISSSALAAEMQLTVSPGHPSKLARIWSACPTFSWANVARAEGYELLVYRLRDEAETVEEVLWLSLEGHVDSWTPPLERCLEPGGQYAWSVRPTGLDGPPTWSSPSFFEVVDRPSEGEFRAALAVLEGQVEPREEAPSPFGSGASENADPPTGVRGASSAETRTSAPADVLLNVDGGVEALFFSGDGSTLTGFDPNKISSGVAPIDVTGWSTGVNCVGCIGSRVLSRGAVGSEEIQDGEVTGDAIDRSEVQARVSSGCPDGAMRAISSAGEPTCTPLTHVARDEEYLVSSLEGEGLRQVLVPQEGRLCFLVYVGMRNLFFSSEDGYCLVEEYVEPTQGVRFWMLQAFSEGDVDAQCGMRCIDIRTY